MINHDWLAGFSAALWPALADHLWQATIVAGLCLLAIPAFRTAGAKSRHLLWSIAFARFVVPQSLVVLLAGLLGFPRSGTGGGLPGVTEKMVVVTRPSTLVVEQQAAGMDSVAAGHSELFCILTIVWIAGFAFFMGRWWLRQHRLAVSLRNSREAGSGIIRTIESLKVRMGLGRRTRLLAVWRGTESGVYGVWRPVLVLPEEMPCHLRPEEVEAVMAHELVHVARWDNLWSNLQMVVCGIFWFYPVVWLLDRRLIAERERFCDERVIGALGNRQAYVSGLVKIAGIGLGFRLAGVSPMTGANLQGRIRNMMNNKRKTSLHARVLLTSIAILAVLLCLMAAPLQKGMSQAIQSNIKIENSEHSPLQIVSAYLEDIAGLPRSEGNSTPRLVKPKIVVKNTADKAIAVYELEFKKPGSDSVFIVRNEGSLAPKATEMIDQRTIEKPTTTVFAGSPAEKEVGGVDGTWTVHVIVVRFENGQVVTLHPMPIPPPSTKVPGGVVRGMRGPRPSGPVPPPSRPQQMKQLPDPGIKEPGAIIVGEQFPESKLVKRIEPVYPELAMKARVQGRVTLVINVDEEGNVTETKVKHGHPLLDDAAVAAVKQWKYNPTFLNGKPVPVIATVTVDFNLK
jgi:TonB family protein